MSRTIPLVPAPPSPPPVWLPGVSVIVAVKDDERPLRRCLDSLRALDYPIVELIVVDRGSRDGSAAVATAAGARLLRADGADEALARNYGVTESTHEIVAFTGADCEVPRGWLRRLVEGLRESKAAGAGGDLRLSFGDEDAGEPAGGEARALEALSSLASRVRGYVAEPGRLREVEHVAASNAAYIRHAFREAGGYADGLWPAADVDLGHRLRTIGYRCRHVAGAEVVRRHPGTLAAFVREMEDSGRAHRLVVERHGRLMPRHLAPAALAALVALHALLVPRRTRAAVLAVDAVAAGAAFALLATHVAPRLWGPVVGCAASGLAAWQRGYREGRRS